MPFIIDASSLINLHHADALESACSVDGKDLLITPLVLGECNVPCASKLMQLNAAGRVQFIDDSVIPADLFLSLLNDYGLGDGETESIAASTVLKLPFCCDDRRARNLAKSILGEDNVFGSLRLLRWCVEGGILACATAHASFESMKQAGGFLPNMEASFFCANVAGC